MNGNGGSAYIPNTNPPPPPPIPLVCADFLGEGGWFWSGRPALPSLHLLCGLCHPDPLFHFNDKVSPSPCYPQPHTPLRTPFSNFMVPKGRIFAFTPSPTQSSSLQLAIWVAWEDAAVLLPSGQRLKVKVWRLYSVCWNWSHLEWDCIILRSWSSPPVDRKFLIHLK